MRKSAWPAKKSTSSVAKIALGFRISGLKGPRIRTDGTRYTVLQGEFVLALLHSNPAAGRAFLRDPSDTGLEILALRRQVAVLKRQRPPLKSFDRLFWTTLSHIR